ncbi:MAG: adenylate kinase [Candidatus Omnitrophica bacterium]|nr:adenylate kinase [Candidatus Omnitrophota bacterium]
MKLILLGPPGAGKGTEAELLKKELSVRHISTGDMLREQVKSGASLGQQAKRYMDSGRLVPDDIVIRMVSERIQELGIKESFALDGFPRTRIQAESLDGTLEKSGRPIDLVLYFETSAPVVIQRLSGRRVCRQCGLNYHVQNMPPKKDGICDQCEGELYQRPDDSEETIRTRLKAYQDQTAELIGYYQAKGLLRKIPGDYEAIKLFEYLKDLFQREGLS